MKKQTTNTEPKVRKNARLNDDVKLYKSDYLDDKPLVRKTVAYRKPGKKVNDRSWGKTPEKAEAAKKAFSQYQADFDKKTYRQFSLKMNAYTEEDICWVLDHSKEGVKQYVLRLIKEDMKRNPDAYKVPKSVSDRAKKAKIEKGYAVDE